MNDKSVEQNTMNVVNSIKQDLQSAQMRDVEARIEDTYIRM